jgi:hypothetical protein
MDLSAWPQNTRLICRRERPHRARSSRSSMSTATATPVFSPTNRRGHSKTRAAPSRSRSVEDRIRTGKDIGIRNLPPHAFSQDQTWFELSLIAQDVLTWIKLTCLKGELQNAEPKRLRHRLLHIAGKLVCSARRTRPPPSRLAMG